MDKIKQLEEEIAILEYLTDSNKIFYDKGEIKEIFKGRTRDETLDILKRYNLFSHIEGQTGKIKIKEENLSNAIKTIENRILGIRLSEHQKKINKSVERLSEDFQKLVSGLSKHQEKLNDSVERLSESVQKLASGSRKSFWISVFMVVVTLLLVWVTYMIVDSNNRMMDQQMEVAAPILKIWQPGELPERNNFNLVQENGWGQWIKLCIRNDGRGSTGAVRIRAIYQSAFNDPEIDVRSENIGNLNPGEANCTRIYINSMRCPEDPDQCDKLIERVPTGYLEIPINVTCLYCDEYIRTYNLELCVLPTDEC